MVEYAYKRKIKMDDLREVLSEIEERAKGFKNIEDWLTHIEEYTRERKLQEQFRKENPNAVSFMTMHGAKGLEFDTVFVIGANEKITPYKKAETIEEIEEERRLFYVAMTRAKKRLVISYTKEKNGKKDGGFQVCGGSIQLKYLFFFVELCIIYMFIKYI